MALDNSASPRSRILIGQFKRKSPEKLSKTNKNKTLLGGHG